MADWQTNLIGGDDDAMRELLATSHRIAVLGIKPESQATAPAHYVPAYLQRAGFELVPVAVYDFGTTMILGEQIYRQVSEVPGPVDIVDVFRRPVDIPPHLDDIIAKRPRAVWFQLGIRNDQAAETLARAGIKVIQDRCIMVEHRRLL